MKRKKIEKLIVELIEITVMNTVKASLNVITLARLISLQ